MGNARGLTLIERPFDNGLFEVLVEPLQTKDERPVVPTHMLKIKRWSNRPG